MFGPKALDEVLARADFVLVTTPLTAETVKLIDRRRLDLMKPTAGLINMSRAGVVDYAALAAKLRLFDRAIELAETGFAVSPAPCSMSSTRNPCRPARPIGTPPI